jgi:hypothetical protein
VTQTRRIGAEREAILLRRGRLLEIVTPGGTSSGLHIGPVLTQLRCDCIEAVVLGGDEQVVSVVGELAGRFEAYAAGAPITTAKGWRCWCIPRCYPPRTTGLTVRMGGRSAAFALRTVAARPALPTATLRRLRCIRDAGRAGPGGLCP